VQLQPSAVGMLACYAACRHAAISVPSAQVMSMLVMGALLTYEDDREYHSTDGVRQTGPVQTSSSLRAATLTAVRHYRADAWITCFGYHSSVAESK
jgi:hypothetical protein